ncbi:MAG: hypothetical protein F6K56_41885 [Moorea sp. SIO3G5]|nr:hypothetical protein [Moorena sp. SIO3G5]
MNFPFKEDAALVKIVPPYFPLAIADSVCLFQGLIIHPSLISKTWVNGARLAKI